MFSICTGRSGQSPSCNMSRFIQGLSRSVQSCVVLGRGVQVKKSCTGARRTVSNCMRLRCTSHRLYWVKVYCAEFVYVKRVQEMGCTL